MHHEIEAVSAVGWNVDRQCDFRFDLFFSFSFSFASYF